MKRWVFTFHRFPGCNVQYAVVEADSREEAIAIFKQRHGDFIESVVITLSEALN